MTAVDKFLRSDGGVYDSAGNVIHPPSELGRLQYALLAPIPEKYIKPDGSIVSQSASPTPIPIVYSEHIGFY